MKINNVLIVLLLSLLILSCTNEVNTKGRTIVISVASDYVDSNTSKLNNPPNDQAALLGQIHALTKGDCELYLFRSELGERYMTVVSDPSELFDYGELEKIDPIKSELSVEKIERIGFNPSSDIEFPWSFRTIENTIRNLNAGKDDIIFFCYSGHGDVDGSLVSYRDSSSIDRIGVNTLLSILDSYNPDALKIVLLDSCFSGNYIKDGILSSSINIGYDGKANEIFKGNSISQSISDSFAVALGRDSSGTQNIYAISAAFKDQEAADFFLTGEKNQMWYGAFSFYLLKALGFNTSDTMPEATGEEITLYTLFKKIWDSFPKTNKKEQTPMVTLSPMDVLLF